MRRRDPDHAAHGGGTWPWAPASPTDSGSLELFKLLAQDGLLFPDESSHDEWVVPGNASVVNSILAHAVRTTLGIGAFVCAVAASNINRKH